MKGAIGGEGSLEESSMEDGLSDPIDSLSMQNPYLTPGSDGSSSHPPPPYTLQVGLHLMILKGLSYISATISDAKGFESSPIVIDSEN